MKSRFVIACLLLVSIDAWSAPARPGWQTRQLADGSLVEVQLVGDEYEHYLVTRDGRVVEEAPEGVRVTARRAPANPQRAPQSAIGQANPVPRGLVILAGFKDLPFQTQNDSAAMDSLMNKSGYNYNGATGSVRDFYIAQSDSQYQPVFDVFGPIVLPKNRADYGKNSNITKKDDMSKVLQMIKDACAIVDPYVDFTNNIGFVYVIYAGIGENDYDGDPDAIWPKRSTVSLTLDNKTFTCDFACSGEIDGGTYKRNGIGPICHEFGHIIGFPDYYDTSTEYNREHKLTPGCWSTMDQGMYNNDCKTPPNYSLFDKYYMGWLTPKVLSKDAKINVTIGTDYEDGYMLTKSGTVEPYTCIDTVYYIENRQKKGWDIGLPGHGMLVWQVMYNSTEWTDSPNNVQDHPHYTLVSAKSDEPIGYSAANSFPGNANITEFTQRPDYAMTDIAEADGKITFKLNGGDPSTGIQEVRSETTDVMRSEKVLIDGQMLIRRGESVYSLTGTRIQ